MSKAITKPVATRVSLEEMAKVRDGLIAKGVDPSKITSISSMVKVSLLLVTLHTDEPLEDPTPESIDMIKQLWNRTKMTSKLTAEDLL